MDAAEGSSPKEPFFIYFDSGLRGRGERSASRLHCEKGREGLWNWRKSDFAETSRGHHTF